MSNQRRCNESDSDTSQPLHRVSPVNIVHKIKLETESFIDQAIDSDPYPA